ncbi:unnamed protein product [Psylliodes chrysocephalus]|uniref:BESS domain-containing protein n=1 Tax=Psylliodes chrysocephalus TaxID=3402493 RepID=A0A9P0CTN8_9CUCU|nr:unnamed protein product [Psylliodes chrysocephala]
MELLKSSFTLNIEWVLNNLTQQNKLEPIYWFRSQSNIQSPEIDITNEDQDKPHNSCTAGDEQERTETDDTVEEQLIENKHKRKRETSGFSKSDKDKPEVSSLFSPLTKRNIPNDTLLKLLQNKEQERQQLGKYVDKLMESSEENEIDLLFKSLVATVKKFQPDDVIEAKMKIFNVVTQIELRNQKARCLPLMKVILDLAQHYLLTHMFPIRPWLHSHRI